MRSNDWELALATGGKWTRHWGWNGGFHKWDTPNSWMVYCMENLWTKWMIWGYPYFRKLSNRTKGKHHLTYYGTTISGRGGIHATKPTPSCGVPSSKPRSKPCSQTLPDFIFFVEIGALNPREVVHGVILSHFSPHRLPPLPLLSLAPSLGQEFLPPLLLSLLHALPQCPATPLLSLLE